VGLDRADGAKNCVLALKMSEFMADDCSQLPNREDVTERLAEVQRPSTYSKCRLISFNA